MTNQNTYDEKWYKRLSELLSLTGEVFAALELPQDELHRRRIMFRASNYSQNPDLLPRHIDKTALQFCNTQLQELLSDLEREEQNVAVKEVYTARIQEMIANNTMIIAATVGDSETFRNQNEFIYGKPDRQIFYDVCSWIRGDAEKTLEHSDGALKNFAKTILQLVPKSTGNPNGIMPDEATFHKIRNLHHQKGGFYDTLFRGLSLPSSGKVGQDLGDEICIQVLKNIGSDYDLAYAENGIWAVLQTQKSVVRPPDYELDRDEFVGIVSHEIGSHLLEAVNGGKQPLRLLETGLDRYEFGSEGRAFLREQIVYPNEATFIRQASWEYIIVLHLGVSLAEGLDGRPYTFSELYNIIYWLFSFWRERRFPYDVRNEQIVRDEAWFLAVRISKGSVGSGGAYMKDIVYLEGNIRCWEVARHQPELILLGDEGKFDIANQSHIQVLQRLGII